MAGELEQVLRESLEQLAREKGKSFHDILRDAVALEMWIDDRIKVASIQPGMVLRDKTNNEDWEVIKLIDDVVIAAQFIVLRDDTAPWGDDVPGQSPLALDLLRPGDRITHPLKAEPYVVVSASPNPVVVMRTQAFSRDKIA